MDGLLLSRCLAAAVAGAGWAYVAFRPRDPFDDEGINDDFYDKIDRQIDEHRDRRDG